MAKKSKQAAEQTQGTTADATADKAGAPGSGKAPGNHLTGTALRALTALAGSKAPLTRAELAEATGVQKGWSRLLGAATKEGGGAAGAKSLEARGLVRCEPQEGGRALAYTITPAGKKALAAAQKAQAAADKAGKTPEQTGAAQQRSEAPAEQDKAE